MIELDSKKQYFDDFMDIKRTLEYLSPRDNEEVYSLDKKISNKVSDLKINLYKRSENSDLSIEGLIVEIKVLIKEREAKVIR